MELPSKTGYKMNVITGAVLGALAVVSFGACIACLPEHAA